MDPLFTVFLGDLTPRGAWRKRADDRNMPTLTVSTRRREQSLFESCCEIETWIMPDIGNRNGGKKEHGSTVLSRTDPWPDHVFSIIRRVKRQRRLFLMLGIPRRSPRVLPGVGGAVKQNHCRMKVAANWRHFFDV